MSVFSGYNHLFMSCRLMWPQTK